MEKTMKKANELHQEHLTWIEELNFYKDEMKTFQKRLEEIAAGNNSHEFSAQLEQFQNQLIRQKEVHDELMHEIKICEQKLEKDSVDNPVAFDHRDFEDHTELRDKTETFKNLYKEFKTKLLDFTAVWI